MSQLGVLLRETVRSNDHQGEANNNSNNTIIGLLRERMELRRLQAGDPNNITTFRSQVKQRFRFKGYLVGCCGSRFFKDTITPNEEDSQPVLDQVDVVVQDEPPPPPHNDHSMGMNLAMALAAERQMILTVSSPARVSLMRLLEETASSEDYCNNDKKEELEDKSRRGNSSSSSSSSSDGVCCVCMGRKKGAALIPCGHTFCRVCSREVWLNRGSCPLCNRSILDILDIF